MPPRLNGSMSAPRGATACLLLGLLGFGLAAYLVVPHLGLMRGELLGGVACGAGGLFNCHIVTGSRWATLLGVPWTLWGIVGYLTVVALALLARQSAELAAHALALVWLLAVVFVAVDLALFWVMARLIRSFCPFCLATYAVNLTLLLVAWRAVGRPWPAAVRAAGSALRALVPSSRHPALWLFWGMMLVGVVGVASLHASTTFISRGTLGNTVDQLREFVAHQNRVSVDITDDPMLGSPQAPLRIVEFSDFRCPVCQRASKLNAVVLANHRDEAAFVFKNFPLDTTCNNRINRQVHTGACQLAAAGECAHRQGRFWALHDRIFEEGEHYNLAHLTEDARRLGLDMSRFSACMASGEGLEAVKRDIAEGGVLEMMSTPTYVINGIRVSGILTPSTFEDLVAALKQEAP